MSTLLFSVVVFEIGILAMMIVLLVGQRYLERKTRELVEAHHDLIGVLNDMRALLSVLRRTK